MHLHLTNTLLTFLLSSMYRCINGPLLKLKIGQFKKISSKKLIIISTGMANEEDIKDALKVIKKTK